MSRKIRRFAIIVGLSLGVMAATVEPALAGLYFNHCEPPAEA